MGPSSDPMSKKRIPSTFWGKEAAFENLIWNDATMDGSKAAKMRKVLLRKLGMSSVSVEGQIAFD